MITFTDDYELIQALANTLGALNNTQPRDHADEKVLVAAALLKAVTSLTREYLDGRDVLTPPLGINGQITITGELETILKQR